MSDVRGGGLTDEQKAAFFAARNRIDRVNEWLQLGGSIAPAEYDRLEEAGITHVVDLREDTESDADPAELERRGIAYLRVPVPNLTAPTLDGLRKAKDWLAAAGEPVAYVHCVGGFGRAATLSVGLLVLDGKPLAQAVEEVRTARPELRINDEQMAWLESVETSAAG